MIIFGYKSALHDCLMDLVHFIRLLIQIQAWCQQLKVNVAEHKREHAVFLTQNGKCEKWLDWSGNLQSVASFFWKRSFYLFIYLFTQPMYPLKFSVKMNKVLFCLFVSALILLTSVLLVIYLLSSSSHLLALLVILLFKMIHTKGLSVLLSTWCLRCTFQRRCICREKLYFHTL